MAGSDKAAERVRAEHRVEVSHAAAGYGWGCSCGAKGKGAGTRTPAGARAAADRHLWAAYMRAWKAMS